MKKSKYKYQHGLRCLKCRDCIYSNYGHDFKYCKCKAIFIDGGLNYQRLGGEAKDMESVRRRIYFTNKAGTLALKPNVKIKIKTKAEKLDELAYIMMELETMNAHNRRKNGK